MFTSLQHIICPAGDTKTMDHKDSPSGDESVTQRGKQADKL